MKERKNKRILIIGSCGAGKSTFAKKMAEITGLPLVHLDVCYWRPGWETTPNDEWREKVTDMLKPQAWIIDGNYRSTLDIRLPVADQVVLLDPPRLISFWRACKRRFSQRRVDPIAGCHERITFDFAKWILWTFPRESRPEIFSLMDKHKAKGKLVVLKNNKEIDRFLNTCKN